MWNVYNSAAASGQVIPVGMTLPASINILVKGAPKHALEGALKITLGVTDDEGNEQRARITLISMTTPPGSLSKPAPAELACALPEPIERVVVPVLQSELARYTICGRPCGGFGSVCIVYHGTTMVGFGSDGWEPNSPRNQSLVQDPEAAELKSDNLDALLAIFRRLQTDGERNGFVTVLLDRLDADKGYLSVSYFIVCALWKLGYLEKTLQRASAALPQGEIKVFGLSNVLLMLNGLLRYRHPDFTDQALDQIERFVHSVQEHPCKHSANPV